MKEAYHGRGSELKEIILGGQDGLVNVLGLVLGVAAATQESRLVIIAALAATFAESISMAAVAYSSVKAAKQYYESQMEIEKREVKEMPEVERKEIRDIYYSRGFRGKLLNDVVRKITSNKKVWLDVMMAEELRLFPEEYAKPIKSAAIVGFSSLVGSLIPIFPYFILPVSSATMFTILVSALALFVTGAIKARITVGNWIRNGIEMTLIGLVAALIGYGIGLLLKMIFPAAPMI